ncbi:MAG: ABC transporter ATP-binding protein [Candidatus Electrothrix sp. AR4]|nr:ABC transporter ATP-binding protein [Candidatus Electrothrix sp. AR4]
MITVKHLTYEYPDTKALDNISFTVQVGAITALVGPNGAGKTTLLKCIAGLVKPYGGSISVDGINVLEEPRRSHEVMGFLTDFFGLYDALTVSQSLEYFALAQNIDRSLVKERAEEVAGLLNLTDKLHSRASSLSRGMRQRLAIGQAMVHYPKVLLLDEPSSGLDPEARMSLAELFLRLNAEKNMTIMVSSHILAELDQYAQDLLILKNGRIVEHTAVTNQSGNKRKVMIRCNSGEERIAAFVQDLEIVSSISRENSHLCLEFTGKDSELSELLHSLVNDGIPVVEFFIKTEGMQEQYLETMRT